ncbi:MAG: hypothetical protein SFX73_27220 [Kofleriaceae bacterium]|nr:hypothetical protein [Kofleriaceae bacterium]
MRTWTVLLTLLTACGNDGSGGGNADAPPTGDAPVTTDAFQPPDGYTKLISRTWSLSAGATDTYRCVRHTVSEDTYITAIDAQAPAGTHHTVLSISDGNTAGPDGDYNCSVGELGMIMLYASGVGTSPLTFPTDVGIKVSAGQQIHLNLHLYNVTDGTLTGESGIWIKSQPTPPPTLAEMVFSGTTNIILPASQNPQPQTVTGTCTAQNDFDLFAVWPHMHQIARHQKVEIIRNGTPEVIHDLDYDFNEQYYFLKSPVIHVNMGDQIRTSCTYLNDTGQLVTVGDGSNKEMCFAGLYRYPARNAGIFECTTGPVL